MTNISANSVIHIMPSKFAQGIEIPGVKEDSLTHFHLAEGNFGERLVPASSKCFKVSLKESISDSNKSSNKMGHPGQNFNKSLHYATNNSRSQSLPNCFDDKGECHFVSQIKSKEDSDVSLNRRPTLVDIESVKPDGKPSNEVWFKTWPERGNEKLTVNDNGDFQQQKFYDIPSKELADLKLCQCNHMSKENANSNVNCNNNSSKLENNYHFSTCLSEGSTNSSIQLVEKCCVCQLRVNPSIGCDSVTNKQADIIRSHKTPIPIAELLQSIPLAYSPVTRQLHFINSKNDEGRNSSCSNNLSKTEGLSNGDSNLLKSGLNVLDSIDEESAKCISTSENEDSLSYDSPSNTLQRFITNDNCLSRTDGSSFSSIVSSLSDVSPSMNEDGSGIESDRLSATYDVGQISIGSSDDQNYNLEESEGVKTKRKGIGSFFSRGVFSWRREGSSPGSSQPGWRLWSGRSSCSSSTDTSADDPQGENKQYGDVVASSSALILHRRPSNLPAKCPDEELKHRHEYQRMVEAARKKELKEAKLKKKQLAQQLRQEEQLAQAARIWNTEILPKWDHMKGSRKARDLWWQGLPPSVRGKVWRLAIGNDLNITHQLYEICVARAQERLRAAAEEEQPQGPDEGDSPDKEASVELIQLDIARTFPHLCIFQQGGPYYDILHCLLGAYVCYRPDVGYMQGMSFIAAVLILNLEPADAFICFANLLNQPCHMAFFRLNQVVMQAYYAAYESVFRENMPRLYAHFTAAHLTADLYLLDWLYTVFAKAMPLDVACRVWDVFLRDGEEFLFKTALGVLHLHQEVLLQLDFLHGAQFLTRLPDDLVPDQLFRSIESIRMSVGKLRFSEVLAAHLDTS